MTKLIKMSLAAAVAVAGLSSTATAGSLADAVKDTTISGKVEVGFNTTESKYGTNAAFTSERNWEYDIDLTLNTKVNDMVTAQVGFQADHDTQMLNNVDHDNNGATANTVREGTDGSDKGTNITLTKMNFTFKTDVATAIVGKQKQPTPFLDDERGDGVVALVPAGPVTLAAGHFTGLANGASLNQDISALAAIGSFSGINASLWYLNIANDVVDGYSANLNGKFGPVAVDLTHSALDYGKGTAYDKQSAALTKIVASAKFDAISVVAGYAMTDDDKDGNGLGVDLSGDDDAKTNFAVEHYDLDEYNDASAFLLGASATFGQTTVGANLLLATKEVSGAADTDITELDLTASYAMSKNFKVSALYATSELDAAGSANDKDMDSIELSMKYSF